MKRISIAPRPGWREKVEGLGLLFHTTAGQAYWDESAYYAFSSAQVASLENAANELQRLCLLAAEHVLTRDRCRELCIPDEVVPWIRETWEMEPPALYGRFDLAFDGTGPPKLLEYNADTPTSLLEAAVIQWYWLEDRFPDQDQFNSIHERLVDKWRDLAPSLRGKVYFAHADDTEDVMTVTYLRDTAEQAGLKTDGLLMAEIGWDEAAQAFVDLQGARMDAIFKLYPWEWMLHEEFGRNAIEARARTMWIEPIWKMLWSNKGILPVLWELFPGHPNLLECYFDEPRGMRAYARKPLLSREGANVQLVTAEGAWETGGDYGGEGHVYQALAPIPEMAGNYPVIGAWMIDGVCAGMGIRESSQRITDNTSRFVPHMIA
jgi:glutathionylspermidine synthase